VWDDEGVSDPVVSGNTLIVVAADGTTTATYIVTVNNPSTVATVTSSTYTVGELTNRAGTIINVPFGTSKVAFESAITKGQADQVWDDEGVSDPVVSGNTLIVVAADGTTTATYIVIVNPFQSATSTITSLVYNVSALTDGSGIITNVPFGTFKTTFRSAITKGQADQTWNSAQIDSTVASGNKLIVTAQDGTTIATYTIIVNPAPNTRGGGGGSISNSTNTLVVDKNLPVAQQIAFLQEQVLKLQTILKQLLAQKGLDQSSTALLIKDLKYGSCDDEVILLQNILKKLNHFPTSIKPIKTFGLITHKAVKDFQIKYGILSLGSPLLGTVGPQTRGKLNKLNK
jgi:hypothetical protein